MTVPFSIPDDERRRRLVRMKLLATGLLVLMAVVFVAAWLLQDAHPALGYVRAAAEAGMVGALADWFAVTALFRRPLGLPIPHTAIIERRKESIGAALSEFVATNFVSADAVRDKLSRVAPAAAIGTWLRAPANAARMTTELAAAARGIIAVVSDERVADLLAQLARSAVAGTRVGPPVGRVAAEVFARGDHRPLVDVVIDRCFQWIVVNRELIVRIVTRRAPGWSPRTVDRLVAERVYREVATFARAVKNDPDHPLRQAVDRFLLDLARDLQTDPATMERADRLAARAMDNEQVRQLAASTWAAAKRTVTEAADDPDSPLRAAVTQGLADLGRQLVEDVVIRERVDAWIADAAGHVAANHGRALAGIIDETIARWDGRRTARLIELHIGKDLQFIRLNGTIVGALAGLAIYSVAQLVLS